MPKQFYVYLMSNQYKNVLYTGFTSDLKTRICKPKNKTLSGFTSKYNVNKLVFYENYDNPYFAISREKQIKAGSRKKKLTLIEKVNPKWKDLYYEL